MAADSRFERLLNFVHDTVQASETPSEADGDLASFIAGHGLADEDIAPTAAIGVHRLFIYRRLVRRGLLSAIRVEIPRTAARLGERFERDVNRFLEEGGPRSHYVRDVAFEFLTFVAPYWRQDDTVLDYVEELAAHELSAFEIAGAAQDRAPVGAAATRARPELSLDAPVVMDPVAKLYRYRFAIHKLSAALSATDLPEEKPTVLLGYRDADHDVRYLELSPIVSHIVERLMHGEALGAAIQQAAQAHELVLDDGLLSRVASVLADLAQRGVLWGASEVTC